MNEPAVFAALDAVKSVRKTLQATAGQMGVSGSRSRDDANAIAKAVGDIGFAEGVLTALTTVSEEDFHRLLEQLEGDE